MIYTNLQSSFASGELDPLLDASIDSALRRVGLRESINTYHLPTGAVRKRPSSEFLYEGAKINFQNKVEIQLPEGSVNLLFTENSIYIDFMDNISIKSLGETLNHSESCFAVYRNKVIETNRNYPLKEYVIIVNGQNVDISWSTPTLVNYKHANPYTCTIANGRLLLSYKDIITASRSPEAGSTRFYDFTLSENDYTWTLEATTTINGWNYKETNYMKNTTGFIDNVVLKELIKKVRVYSRTESRPISPKPSNEPFNEDVFVEYTITDNYSEGNLFITDAIKKEEKNGIITRKSTESYPDILPVGLSYAKENERTVPFVLVSHGAELIENDMYTTEIVWMASLGRLIVGTKQAIFISTEEVITPQTFDLRVSSYIGCAKMQPRILHNELLFVSSDEKKLYAISYNDNIKGMNIVETSINARHLFIDGIKFFDLTDSPYRTIFVVTKKNELRVSSIANIQNSIIFSWFRWEMQGESLPLIYFDRGITSSNTNLKLVILNESVNDKIQIHKMSYNEIYNYDIDSLKLYLDHQQSYDLIAGATELTINDSFLLNDTFIDAIFNYDDGYTKVVRGIEIKDRKIAITSREKPAKVLLGIPVKMHIRLFQQLLPSRSGVSLESKHTVNKISLKIFKSVGGEVIYNSLSYPLLQLMFGVNNYDETFIDNTTNKPYSFTGVYSVSNPTQGTKEDSLIIESNEPYPFNLMGLSLKYNVTEVN